MPSHEMVMLATAGGVLAGWLLRSLVGRAGLFGLSNVARSRSHSLTSSGVSEPAAGDYDSESDDDISVTDDGEYKMVIAIRTDLKMGKGKIAAQCCHAACGSMKKSMRTNPTMFKMWEQSGQPKIVTKVDNEATLLELAQIASALGLTNQIIRDAGRTQIAPGSLTALAVGPGPNELVDQVTRSLKLL